MHTVKSTYHAARRILLRIQQIANFNFNFKTGLFQTYVPYRVGNNYYQLVVINGLIYGQSKDFSVKVLTLVLIHN